MNPLNERLSLHQGFCKECGGKCCFEGESYGSPILSAGEILDIAKVRMQDHGAFEIIGDSNKPMDCYGIINPIPGTLECWFLGEDKTCSIQKVKPLDCLCYPIKAIYKDGRIIYVVDTQCPASNSLDIDFIRMAKRIAMQSILRFTPEAYNDWLKNYIKWVWTSAKLLNI